MKSLKNENCIFYDPDNEDRIVKKQEAIALLRAYRFCNWEGSALIDGKITEASELSFFSGVEGRSHEIAVELLCHTLDSLADAILPDLIKYDLKISGISSVVTFNGVYSVGPQINKELKYRVKKSWFVYDAEGVELEEHSSPERAIVSAAKLAFSDLLNEKSKSALDEYQIHMEKLKERRNKTSL